MLLSLALSPACNSCLIHYKVQNFTALGAGSAVLVLVVPLSSWETLGISGHLSALSFV